jgi:hypothetical protein
VHALHAAFFERAARIYQNKERGEHTFWGWGRGQFCGQAWGSGVRDTGPRRARHAARGTDTGGTAHGRVDEARVAIHQGRGRGG